MTKKIPSFTQVLKDKYLLIILVAVIILRIPSLFEPYWYGDEAIYLTLGEGIRQGLTLYKDIFDHKPPAIYVLAALAGSVFWFRLVLLFWHTVTLVLFWDLSSRLFKNKTKPVVLSTFVFAALTTLPILEGHIANAEIFMMGPVIAALALFFAFPKPSSLLLTALGILFSISTLFKIPALFDFLAFIAFLAYITSVNLKDVKNLLQKVFYLSLGFALPIVISILYFWSQNALFQYLETAWSQNFVYISRWHGQENFSLLNTITQAGLLVRTVVLAIFLGGIYLLRKRLDKTTLFASLWFVFALFASLLSARPYPHYLIQVIPPLSILLTIIVFGKEKQRFFPVPILLIFLTSLLVYKFYYYPTFSYYGNFFSYMTGQKNQTDYYSAFDHRMPYIYSLSNFITQRTSKNDHIFIWGTAPELYALSHRLPPGRYITSFHIIDFGGEQETLTALEEEKPRYIIVLNDETRELPGLSNLLQNNYVYMQTLGNTQVWKNVDKEVIKTISK